MLNKYIILFFIFYFNLSLLLYLINLTIIKTLKYLRMKAANGTLVLRKVQLLEAVLMRF